MNRAMMDREWMYKRLNGKFLSSTYAKKVDEFIELASKQDKVMIDGLLKCPCVKCRNVPYLDPEKVKLHLYQKGFLPNYYKWTFHGEDDFDNSTRNGGSTFVGETSNPYKSMVLDALGPNYHFEDILEESMGVEDPLPEFKKFIAMLKDAEKPLYDGCKLSLLSVASRVTNLKCEYNIPHKAIDSVASLIKDICPELNNMTDTFYRTRKLLDGLELPHYKIDVCPNGCMLFWKEHEHLNECLICKGNRYKTLRVKGKRTPRKVLYYLPIAPRLQRLYATQSTAKQMTWHAENPRKKGLISHPSDGEAWKKFDEYFSDFAKEPRNVRLGLCTDGFSPFGKSGKPYSCWPVMLTPYNLPPWLCMKKPFIFLSLIIPGPKSPKGNLDVFLQPLIEELVSLWEVGVPTYDVSRKQNFQMKAALHWTVSDFPAYGMLSGWTTAGKLACPYCMENTKAFTLKNGRKQTWFDCHRPFLPHDHPFRRNKSAFFKNRVVNSYALPRLSGEEVWERVSGLPTTRESSDCGLKGKLKGYGKSHNWTKQSIFWQLPYWSKLLIRHNLDVMHIEKNVFDNVFHTVMDVKGKTKDNLSARKDLVHFCKRQKLEVRDECTNNDMPSAPYVMSKEKRKALCEWLQRLKLPDRYASNLSRCVDTKEYKLFGMKSHDCHIFMQRLIPIAFKDLFPTNVWNALTELSQFFRDLCSSSFQLKDIVRLEENIPEIICKMEKIFPPSFFNCMEHLPIHLPFEAIMGGPVQYRWMYPFERFLYHLKKKVGNKAQVEASICNAYLTEEISNFCSHYFEAHVNTRVSDLGLNLQGDEEPSETNLPEIFSCSTGYSASEGQFSYLDDKDYDIGHRYVLGNCEILSNFESLFEEHVSRTYGCLDAKDVWTHFDHLFSNWFKEHVLDVGITDDVIHSLALGPSTKVRKFDRYHINGYYFHTFSYGKNKNTANHGVCVKGVEGNEYFGVLQEVIELVYIGAKRSYKTVLFKCEWFDPGKQGTRIHGKYKLVEVNHTRKYPNYDPFVLAYQAEQVYFAPCPSIKNFFYVCIHLKHEFRWDPSNAKKVRKEWQSKCSRRLTDIVSKICTRPTYVAPWCAPSIREELIKIRKQEEFQLKSRQCSKNRMNNDSQKIHHRQGSISTEEVRCKLEKKLNRKPTAAELYFDGHVDNEGHFVNAKAEIVWKEFEKRKAENLECETENQKTEDQIFYDATGGWSDKGRIFGLGAAAHSYFERPGYNEKDKAKKSRRDYIVNLENKVADLIAENSQQKEELHVTKEGLIETQKNLAETTKSLKALEQQVQILMQANHGSLIPSSSSSSPRPHP